MTQPAYSRVVLKMSGDSFKGDHDFGIDADTLEVRMMLYDPTYYTEPWAARPLVFTREPRERLTYFGWYGIFSGISDLMCAPMNFQELHREGAY